MNKQRGSALILVLVALALGSMLITSTMGYVYTGLVEAGISDKQLLKQYAADSAVEYAIWELKYNVNGITDNLSMGNPSSSNTLNMNGMEASATTEISPSPEPDEGQIEVPPHQPGLHIAAFQQILAPNWSKSGEKDYFTHLIYIYNYGTAAVHLKTFLQKLDAGLEYVPESYDGPDANLASIYVNDHWELHFEFEKPLPGITAQEAMVISFTASAEKDMGDHTFSGSGWVEYAGFQETIQESYSGTSGPFAVGLYDITVDLGSVTVLVNVGVTETGEIVVRSYQYD
ncbi:hypothetical protein ACFLWE_01415 [Chloroflexota bacterium]